MVKYIVTLIPAADVLVAVTLGGSFDVVVEVIFIPDVTSYIIM